MDTTKILETSKTLYGEYAEAFGEAATSTDKFFNAEDCEHESFAAMRRDIAKSSASSKAFAVAELISRLEIMTFEKFVEYCKDVDNPLP